MAVVILGIGVPVAIIKNNADKTVPHQEVSRLLRVPTETARRVIVPPCGTGVPVTSARPDTLAKTAGSVVIILKRNRGDRLVLIPRCRASQGAAPSEGVN